MIETTFRTHVGPSAASPARQRFVAVLATAIRDVAEAPPSTTRSADTFAPAGCPTTLPIVGAR